MAQAVHLIDRPRALASDEPLRAGVGGVTPRGLHDCPGGQVRQREGAVGLERETTLESRSDDRLATGFASSVGRTLRPCQ
jgi:hypothetical protein